MYTRIIFLICFFFAANKVSAQDLDQLLSETNNTSTDYTTATFKSTRIINGHSVERMQTGQLDVRIEHRFGMFSQGGHDLWGLDGPATIHLSLEYGITNWLMAGVGRGNIDKTYDGFLKYSWLRQSKGARNMPVSVSFLATTAVITDYPDEMGLPGKTVYFWDRFSYVYQVLVARKFNERFSLEINPTIVHRNMVLTEMDPSDLLSIGTGARFKLSKRISLNAEWYHVFPPLRDYRSAKTYDPIAIGFDIETGGHVFQIMFTNSESMIEKGFIGETTGQWGKNNIHLGFNISRVFALK